MNCNEIKISNETIVTRLVALELLASHDVKFLFVLSVVREALEID